MLKILKSKDCSKPKTKKCSRALTKYAKKKYGKKTKDKPKASSTKPKVSSSKSQISTAKDTKAPVQQGNNNKISYNIKSHSGLPNYKYDSNFGTSTNSNYTTENWFAPQLNPTPQSGGMRMSQYNPLNPINPNYKTQGGFTQEQLKSLADYLNQQKSKTAKSDKTTSSSSSTGSSTESGTNPPKGVLSGLGGYNKPKGATPKYVKDNDLVWDRTDINGYETDENGRLKGYKPRTQGGKTFNPDTGKYEREGL